MALSLLLLLLLTGNFHGVKPFSAQQRTSPPSFAWSLAALTSSAELPGETGRRLVDVVCLVTGASRGIGKGIAMALAKEGATVYVTGTSSRAATPTLNAQQYSTNDNVGGPGTIEDTAQAVTAAGGVGIPVLCNHADDRQVKALFDQIETTHGRLDLLVNNVFRVPPGGANGLFGKFYELPMDTWDTLFDVGVRAQYVASVFAIPLLLKSRSTTKLPRPFIAMVSSFGGLTYTFNVPYGVGKAAIDRMAKDMAIELCADDIAVTSFWPGVVFTEQTERMVKTGEWQSKVGIPLENSESPEFTGRAIVAVATDTKNMNKSGTTQVVAELAQAYKFTDTNGRTPPSIRSLRFLLPAYGMDEAMRSKVPISLIPDWKLPFWIMANGKPPEKKETSP